MRQSFVIPQPAWSTQSATAVGGSTASVWIDIDRPNRTLKVVLDGQNAMSSPALLDPACATTGDVAIDMGLQCASGGSAGAEVLFDSVVVTGPG
jgi:hypothetical protein